MNSGDLNPNSGHPHPNSGEPSGKKYKGVRQRRWGKWVSEIRIPGSRERLWLGSYSSPEAAAAAHDTAVFFLRGPEAAAAGAVNFPQHVASFSWACLSPSSIQTAAANAGLAIDARRAVGPPETSPAVGGGSEEFWFDDVELSVLDGC